MSVSIGLPPGFFSPEPTSAPLVKPEAASAPLVEEALYGALRGLLEFLLADLHTLYLAVGGHIVVERHKIVGHDLLDPVVGDPFAVDKLEVGHNKCHKIAMVVDHYRLGYVWKIIEFLLNLLGIDVLTRRIIVFERPEIVRKPSASIVHISPVFIHPCPIMTSAVASGLL